MAPVSPGVKTRPYDSTRRRQAAARRRERVLAAARELFTSRGYAGTTMADVAAAAGVALDTVYALVGPKPQLFRLLVESAISGEDEGVPVLERDYIGPLLEEPTAAGKLEIYVDAIAEMQSRLAPLFQVLQAAADEASELGQIWSELLERRARNMPLLVEELARTGSVRADLSVQEAADDIWVLNSTEVYCLLVRTRGWTLRRYRRWLHSRLSRLLLDSEE